MKASVTDRQVFFVLFLTLTAYTVISIPKVIAQKTGSGGWTTILFTSLVFAAFAWVIVRLNSAFPGKMLFDYSRRIVGKAAAYVLAAYFALYFLLVAVHLNMQLTAVLRAEFYPKTPQWVMLVATLLVIGSVAYRGVTNVGRFFEVIGSVFVLTAVATHLIMFLQGQPNEVLPLFRASQIPEYLLGTKDVVIAFLGIELLTVFPLSGRKSGRTAAAAFLTVLFVGVFYVVVVESCIMMLGMQSTKNYSYALIEAIKQIDNPILERFDILFLTVGFAALVAGICGVYLALVEYATRLFKKPPRIAVVAGAGAAIVALSVAGQSMKNSTDLFESALLIAGPVSALLIPGALLLTAKVRGLVQKPR
ncbi:MAG: GerAB/ArcD/ProY family transporter [Clostridiales bacterium]|nr:GerAB/ArcD/ProY family transporter [Clostridiales bacterium]